MSEKLKILAKNIKPNITNEVIDDKLVITLSGFVGEPYWFNDDPEDFINEKRVKALVGDNKQDIIIKLNSPGGDVFEGIAVYNYLKDLPNRITVEVTALAASAASIIAMSADELVMCTGSQMMIHKAITNTVGDDVEHQKSTDALRTINRSLASIYAERTGLDRDLVTDWVSAETWFTAEEAVEQGLADAMKAMPTKTNETQEYQNVTVHVDTDKIVAQVIEHFTAQLEQPKTGLNKIFGGKK